MTTEPVLEIGGTASGTAGATAKITFTPPANYPGDFPRRMVAIASTGASSLYLKAVQKGAAAPTVSSSDFHWAVPSGSTLHLRVGGSVDLYLFGTTTYSAVEMA